MSTTLRPLDAAARSTAAAEARTAWQHAEASRRARVLKLVCAVLLGVCFWFSVPYGIPRDNSTGNLQQAAAAAADTFAGSLSRQIAMPCIALLAVHMLWRFRRLGVLAGRLRWAAMLFLGWAVISLTWSQAPGTTGKRLVVLLADALFAYALARTASLLEIALWGFSVTGTVALISLGLDISYQHSFAPLNPDYRFAGVMQANVQAMNLVACIVCAMTLLLHRPRWARALFPCVAAALSLLYLTRSRLSTVLCVGLLLGMLVRWSRTRFQPRTRVALLLAGCTVLLPGLVLVFGGDPGGAAERTFMMGRNDTENTASLSNRAPLWAELSDSVAAQPWLGAGYEGFWTPARVERVSLDQGWAVPHAHNTYLDQWLSLGVIGMLLYCAAVWGACVVAWQRYRRTRTPEGLFAAVLLTWLALEGIAESVPLDPFLPTLLAYTCLVKMCLREGSEPSALPGEPIVHGLPALESA